MAVTNPATTHRAEAPTAYSAENTMSVGSAHEAQTRRRLFKTSEFAVFVVAVIGVLLASYLVEATDGHADYFSADRAWFYVVLLSIGYMVSRGLAKGGSRNRRDG